MLAKLCMFTFLAQFDTFKTRTEYKNAAFVTAAFLYLLQKIKISKPNQSTCFIAFFAMQNATNQNFITINIKQNSIITNTQTISGFKLREFFHLCDIRKINQLANPVENVSFCGVRNGF